MRARALALGFGALLAGCVQTPMGPQVPFDYTHLGLPLAASEVVATFVSTGVSPRDLREQEGRVAPIASTALVTDGIVAGFRALPTDLRIAAGDEPLRRGCFDTGIQATERVWADAVLSVPDPGRGACRALVDERGIRYLVSVGGYRWTGPQEGWGESLALGSETVHVYWLTAQVFDVTSGNVVCAASDHLRAASNVGVAWVYVPIPFFSVVDESAYWKRVAWNVGNKLRSCFLPPAAGTQP